MTWKTIEKPRQGWTVVPNLLDYERTRAEFSWDGARRELDEWMCCVATRRER